ncbi:hypothetical protein TRM7615_04517 [Falsiruegeria mediterranea M17]|uniref:VOC domain-containing protein n=1 Tax=Falsiruegeria mediterranea M17 TaxID=1200281 RepID=A0A2R8CF01_9RHOB|nr:hypothetical protein TRM7615_04517 [Falsiruegeria mediterranea M17]
MPQQLFAIALVVPDYDAALAFYVDRLGFTLDQDEDLGDGKRWVRVTPPGGTAGSIILAKADGAQQETAIGNQTGGVLGSF